MKEDESHARSKTSGSFEVFVDDNFHYMDRSERYKHGDFDSVEAAVAACKKIVDEFLVSALKEGMTAQELWEVYVQYGEDPFIIPALGTGFSAWGYAKLRCFDLCPNS